MGHPCSLLSPNFTSIVSACASLLLWFLLVSVFHNLSPVFLTFLQNGLSRSVDQLPMDPREFARKPPSVGLRCFIYGIN